MEENEPAGAPAPSKAIERVTLGKEEALRVFSWLRQLEDLSKGFLQLSRSDVVNFLIREHKAELSTREVHLFPPKTQEREAFHEPLRSHFTKTAGAETAPDQRSRQTHRKKRGVAQ